MCSMGLMWGLGVKVCETVSPWPMASVVAQDTLPPWRGPSSTLAAAAQRISG